MGYCRPVGVRKANEKARREGPDSPSQLPGPTVCYPGNLKHGKATTVTERPLVGKHLAHPCRSPLLCCLLDRRHHFSSNPPVLCQPVGPGRTASLKGDALTLL